MLHSKKSREYIQAKTHLAILWDAWIYKMLP